MSVAFRFDAPSHQYFDAGGDERPHITGLLRRAGLTDDTWYLEEQAERGQHIHTLTARYDLGALDLSVDDCGAVRGYLLAHAKVMAALKPTWTHIEVPMLCEAPCFGGRPDRVGTVRLPTVYEVKTGGVEKWHQIQTALQAILAAAFLGGLLPAERFQRLAGYYKANGKFKVETHINRRDFDEARDILRVFV